MAQYVKVAMYTGWYIGVAIHSLRKMGMLKSIINRLPLSQSIPQLLFFTYDFAGFSEILKLQSCKFEKGDE